MIKINKSFSKINLFRAIENPSIFNNVNDENIPENNIVYFKDDFGTDVVTGNIFLLNSKNTDQRNKFWSQLFCNNKNICHSFEMTMIANYKMAKNRYLKNNKTPFNISLLLFDGYFDYADYAGENDNKNSQYGMYYLTPINTEDKIECNVLTGDKETLSPLAASLYFSIAALRAFLILYQPTGDMKIKMEDNLIFLECLTGMISKNDEEEYYQLCNLVF